MLLTVESRFRRSNLYFFKFFLQELEIAINHIKYNSSSYAYVICYRILPNELQISQTIKPSACVRKKGFSKPVFARGKKDQFVTED